MSEPQPKPDKGGRPGRRAMRWPLVLGVAVVTVVAVLVATRHPSEVSTATDQREPVSDSPPANPADLVVRDGTTVEGRSMIIAEPGQPVMVCPPKHTVITVGERDDVPVCGYGVPATGVNLDQLYKPDEANGMRWGYATLRGVWHGAAPEGTIEVTAQAGVQLPAAPLPTAYPVQQPPCQEPPGGWKPNPEGLGNQEIVLYPYIYGHADQFRHPDVLHPYGGSNTSSVETSVLVVEVVMGDVDQARREIESRYRSGNLCVAAAPGKPSIAEQGAQARPIERAISALEQREAGAGIFEESGLQGGGPYKIGGVNDDHRWLMLAMVTPRIYDALSPVGFEHVGFRPWLRPVR